MEGVLGLWKLRVKRGINLVARDTKSSDPYLIATLDGQTKVTKANCNPEWNDELTLTMRDPEAPIHIAVYDKDMFSNDDSMGEAEIDVNPYIEGLRTGLNPNNNVPNGTILHCVHPTEHNCLAKESSILLEHGKIVQDMNLKLRALNAARL